MNLLIKLRDWIAQGNSPTFVAFNAHCWSAALIVLILAHLTGNVLAVFLSMGVYAAVKEFWFDASYEIPKQSFKDNAEDFIGYWTGALIGSELYLHMFH